MCTKVYPELKHEHGANLFRGMAVSDSEIPLEIQDEWHRPQRMFRPQEESKMETRENSLRIKLNQRFIDTNLAKVATTFQQRIFDQFAPLRIETLLSPVVRK